MELRHLRYFVTVAELLSFTKAARRLRVAQPALSRQIQDLEEELGLKLFQRGTRPLKLTEAGAAYQVEARAVLQRAEQAAQTAQAVARGEQGEIHLSYAPTPTVELLPRILDSFQKTAPGVKVTLHDLSSEEMLRGLVEGRLQLSLTVRPSPRALRGLKFEMLREYPVCAALRPGHPLARQRHARLDRLVDEPLLAYSRLEYPDYLAQIDVMFAPLGRSPRVAEEHDSSSGILAAAEIGRGWMLAPSCLEIQVGKRLVLRRIEPAPPPMAVGVAYDPHQLTHAAARLLTAARAAGRQAPAPEPERG
jgi:LysR family transcriptional regulator, benzoate and cis,cis-muconate-responsive activator of ben and cat genes